MTTLAQQNQEEQEKKAIRDFKNGLTAHARAKGVEVKWDGDCTVNGVHMHMDITGLRGQAAGGIQVALARPRINHRHGLRPLVWRTRKAGWDFEDILTCLVTQAEERSKRDTERAALEARLDSIRKHSAWTELQTRLVDTLVGATLTPDGTIVVSMHGLTLEDAVRIADQLVATPVIGDVDDRIRRLALRGAKIEAIKLHRELYGSSLLTAKNVVEAMGAKLP